MNKKWFVGWILILVFTRNMILNQNMSESGSDFLGPSFPALVIAAQKVLCSFANF